MELEMDFEKPITLERELNLHKQICDMCTSRGEEVIEFINNKGLLKEYDEWRTRRLFGVA